jgi:hypothetical protein
MNRQTGPGMRKNYSLAAKQQYLQKTREAECEQKRIKEADERHRIFALVNVLQTVVSMCATFYNNEIAEMCPEIVDAVHQMRMEELLVDSELTFSYIEKNSKREKRYSVSSYLFQKYLESLHVNYRPSDVVSHFVKRLEKKKTLNKVLLQFFDLLIRKKITERKNSLKRKTEFPALSENVQLQEVTVEEDKPLFSEMIVKACELKTESKSEPEVKLESASKAKLNSFGKMTKLERFDFQPITNWAEHVENFEQETESGSELELELNLEKRYFQPITNWAEHMAEFGEDE